MTTETVALLTVNTLKGMYQFTRLLFGVAAKPATPAIFQCFKDTTFSGRFDMCATLDDIVLRSAITEAHPSWLEVALGRHKNRPPKFEF